VTEVGRQPWTVYGVLRTANSVSPSLTGHDVALSLLAYMTIYLAMYPAGFSVIARMVRQGCTGADAREKPPTALQPKVPFATPAE
jgi:cytochrome bd ubiquinol oxidase subunit I